MWKYVCHLLLVTSAASFVVPLQHTHGRTAHRGSSGHENDTIMLHANMISRRDYGLAVATAFTFTNMVLLPVTMANAAGAPGGPTKEDLERLKVGHENIVYLLNNFEKETTVCRENGGECKRDSDAVRRALGLRSTTDPLFQIEKVFIKVKNMDLDSDKLDAFFEATEDWNTAMNMSNSMAFISQFGEYNPGGGKDAVLKYLEESRTQVIRAEKALKTILDCLDIA